MGWIEYMLIVAGSSLDIFAAMECQGALVQKVNKRQLTAICAIIALFQIIVFLAIITYTEFGNIRFAPVFLQFDPRNRANVLQRGAYGHCHN